jgi:hypothetical protein
VPPNLWSSSHIIIIFLCEFFVPFVAMVVSGPLSYQHFLGANPNFPPAPLHYEIFLILASRPAVPPAHRRAAAAAGYFRGQRYCGHSLQGSDAGMINYERPILAFIREMSSSIRSNLWSMLDFCPLISRVRTTPVSSSLSTIASPDPLISLPS